MIIISSINQDNLFDVCELTSNSDGIATVLEDYICCNATSIAEASYFPNFYPKALYFQNNLIGFFMYKTTSSNLKKVMLCRYMLDYKFIGKGLGRKSFKAILDFFSAEAIQLITLGINEKNTVAKNLYQSFGFEFTGNIIDGEHIYHLNLWCNMY
ncbi:GNAT family N-acetyltransferase [Providencia huaxiensis]|nr:MULTISPECIES: GNAT family N-acetyltransferase [Providencia]MDI7241391.1 GNAT family N-acetyltransferase [Providencia huaxiensis]